MISTHAPPSLSDASRDGRRNHEEQEHRRRSREADDAPDHRNSPQHMPSHQSRGDRERIAHGVRVTLGPELQRFSRGSAYDAVRDEPAVVGRIIEHDRHAIPDPAGVGRGDHKQRSDGVRGLHASALHS